MYRRTLLLASAAAALAATPLAVHAGQDRGDPNPVLHAYYDGVSDDLLTGGLGRSGLQGGAPPLSDPPSAAQLRRLAIYNNYRALIDPSDGGGFGRFYGPNVTAQGEITDAEGLIAGHEYLRYAPGGGNVALMVQVPDHFDPASACIVTAPSSGSRGVYGAIGTAGEWGLKRGCAVAYTDKGSGNGAHNLQADTVTDIQGLVGPAGDLRRGAHFRARLSEAQRLAFNDATPDRLAYKHAHSRRNPERDWGRNVLQSIEFAFAMLRDQFPRQRFGGHNTLVIASSVSNGGGASLRAAELDRGRLIDAVAVSEPNVNPERAGFAIVQGGGAPLHAHSRSLYDYTTVLHVYQPCANLAAANAGAPFNFAPSAERCQALQALGLLRSATLAEQAAEAQRLINDAGIIPEQNIVQPSHWFVRVTPGIGVTYANAYARAGVTDNLCGFSMGATDALGAPVPLAASAERALFGTGNGIPPTGGVNLIYNLAAGGPIEERLSTSPSTGLADQNLDGALCLRSLHTGRDPVSGARLNGRLRAAHQRLQAGVRQIRASGRLHGIPAVIVTGRNDAILPINHTSRAYYGLNRVREGDRSGLCYYEITNAHHLDAFNAFPGFSDKFVPLHHYLFEALDLVYEHLTEGRELPPSQVVVTRPRGVAPDGSVPPLGEANLTPISPSPAPANRITFAGQVLHVPQGN